MGLCDKLLNLDRNTSITQYLANLSNADFMQEADSLFEKSDAIQEQLLMQMLSYAEDSIFGQKYGFANITSLDDFRKHLPVLSWKDYEPYVEQLVEGKENVLFPGKATFFTMTSGSSGKEKYIPDNAMSACARNLVLRWRLKHLFKFIPN